MSESSPVPAVTLMPSGRHFECLPGRSLLQSGLAAGIALPYNCSNGTCGECRARLLVGEVEQIKRHEYVIPAADKLAGTFLLCSNSANQNVTLEVAEARSVEDIPAQTLSAKVCRREILDEVCIVAFKFQRGKALRFLPGQQVRITLPAGGTYLLPIASCPCNARYVEFHVALHQAGSTQSNPAATGLINLRTNDKVSINGPEGNLTLPEHVVRPQLFIACGIGFAQLKGLIEQIFDIDTGVNCSLLWQASRDIGHYQHNLCRSWADAFDEFAYLPLNPDADLLDAVQTQFKTNLVRTNPGAINLGTINLGDTDIYLSGAPKTLSQQLITAGAAADHLWSVQTDDQTT